MTNNEKEAVKNWGDLLIAMDYYYISSFYTLGNQILNDGVLASFLGNCTELECSYGDGNVLYKSTKTGKSVSLAEIQAQLNIHWLEESNFDFREAYKRMHGDKNLSDFYVEMVLQFPTKWHKGIEMNDSVANVAIREDIDTNTWRNNFKIPYEENIFYVRDTSFWSVKDQGLVITDVSIYMIPDNDEPDDIYILNWEDVVRVTYKENMLFFWGEQDVKTDDAVRVPLNWFAKGTYNAQALGNALAEYFTHLAKLAEPKEDPLLGEVSKLCEQHNFDEAIEQLKQRVDENPAPFYYYMLGDTMAQKADFVETDGEELNSQTRKDAIAYYTKALELCEPDSVLGAGIRHYRGVNELRVGDTIKAREDLLSIMSLDHIDLKELIESAKELFPSADNGFAEQFQSIDYAQRKALMVVDEYTELGQNQIQVLSKEMANKYLKFPIGHPHSNQLYIAHPLINDYYLPFEDYQLIFVEDQVREYCELAQALGATEITVECLNDKQSDSEKDTKTNINGNVAGKTTKLNGEYHRDFSHHLIDSIRQSIEMHQTYSPTMSPRIPDGLVWYQQMPSWQHLVKQRMNGGLNSHEEKLQTQKSQVVDGNELKQIKGEVKTLLKNAGIDFDKGENSKFQLQENATLSIRIKFAPLDQLQGNAIKNVQQNITLSAEEQSFLNEVKFCLEEINALSDTDKKYLDRKRAKLGLSPERAEEIIQMCLPALSAEEQEYMDTFHELVTTAEDISPKIRRILDREAESLGISEERKVELEKL